MTLFRFIGISLVLPTLLLPQLVFASHNNDDDTARLFVYVRTVSSSGLAVDPWRFQVSVSGDADAHPYRFEGSSNGTVVDIDANEEFEVTADERFGYDARYSGMCDGELDENEVASCYITLADERGGSYPYSYAVQPNYPVVMPQPYAAQPVSVVQTYIPSQLPNTGFDPSLFYQMIAFAAVLLLGSGVAVYPYARKVVASIR
jgi:hypothetical protein